MKHKNKEIIKDVLFMTWSFLGGTLFLWLSLINDFNYFTGSVINKIANFTTYSFYLIIAPLLSIFFVGVCCILKRLKI